jgi:hypothetical protein
MRLALVKAVHTVFSMMQVAAELDEVRRYREDWAVSRDRRPGLVGPLFTMDGRSRAADVK